MMALPGGMPPGMGMGGANAGMSEQERQMVKYVRFPTPNPKSESATMRRKVDAQKRTNADVTSTNRCKWAWKAASARPSCLASWALA